MSLLVTIPINECKSVNIYQGTHGKYYTISNKTSLENPEVLNEVILKYDIHFPIDWAEDDNEYCSNNIVSKVGVKYCYNCIDYCFYNGVVIGYCGNCVQLLEYKRGNGMLPEDIEINEETKAFDLSNIKEENSMWNTYLSNVKREEIGDTLLKEEYEVYKDLPPLISIPSNFNTI
jgi:hypothetical protein